MGHLSCGFNINLVLRQALACEYLPVVSQPVLFLKIKNENRKKEAYSIVESGNVNKERGWKRKEVQEKHTRAASLQRPDVDFADRSTHIPPSLFKNADDESPLLVF